MAFPRVFVFALLVGLALLQSGLSEDACQARVVLTSQAELREEIVNALQSISGIANISGSTPSAEPSTGLITEQTVARIENKLDVMNKKLGRG